MNTQIGRYQIIDELGRGGMGAVYLAYDLGLKREVAVKVLLDKWKDDSELRFRFEQEANTMATLKHPAIVPVHDLGEENNQPYFVMSYMSGGSLLDRLRNGPMSLQEVENTLHHVAAALDKVHDHGLIHRDIKPANILFDEDGRLYLTDFGIARPVVPGKVTEHIGTRAYMAPEQITGHNLDRRSDVYQLGVVLFQMLTRHLPTPYDISSVYDYNPNLPRGCDEVIARALATKKEDRYPTAGDLAAEFTAVVEGSGTSTRREGNKANSRFFTFWAAITTGILLGVAILAAVMFWPRTPNPPIGLLISFTPPVDVKHGDRLKEAEVGLKLYPDDVVIAQANAGAVVSLSCPEKTLLFTVGALQNMPVDCGVAAQQRIAGEDLIAQLNPDVISSQARSVVVLPPQEVRASRQTEEQTPLLLTPRNTLIADTQPTFQWQGVEGATGYRLSLNIPNAENWEVESTDTTLPYPADNPPLPAGSTNIVKLATLDNPTEADETFVDVMDSAAQAELAQREAEIRNLGVDDTAQAYLLAQLYRQQEMKAAAIAQLEQIAANQNQEAISADLWQQLGDLYFEIGLYTQAEEKYENALSVASANDDQQAQALANFGLAQTAYVFEEDEQALDYLNQAETLSDQIGDNALSEAVAQLKQQIEN